ncbi:utrophin-like [Eudromia elegans]
MGSVLKGENQQLIDYRRRLAELRCWLENVENALDTRFTFDHEENLSELKVFSEEMEGQADNLDWLNRTEPAVLLDKNVCPREKDKLSDSLQSLNVRWNKVFKEVPDRLRELEVFVRQPHLVAPRKHSDVQKVVLVSSSFEIPVQAQQALELSAPADLDKTTTELGDWLILIDQMLKSNIVTVGNAEDISRTISRMKITKADLDQRHPQLDSVFTLAQNLKNKTSSSDIRTVITEKLEKVKSQWDGTQHGVEERQQQLKRMLADSVRWDEQRQDAERLMEHCELRLRLLLQAPREALPKQLADSKTAKTLFMQSQDTAGVAS